ncbi:related to ERG8 - phosphomevalonate kinase [Melanopsichium pennsylvanicum]|uniref:phosphomevalonate kinase n=2 Tax=Melanopsichium pennsylvanicum TaxID=63383 RepID=A0AAJ5C4Y6_9BASI|nr:related to ERG8-phosphomevalonate kinase [Melanopsichium pennsylvanicum 4]SNX84165.1 related to ERG8 - phosphomevalonate kinase [Melanopsichium pennsylvanicum]
MASKNFRETSVSTPGKVLVAGGYLVLDPAYPGLVVSTSSRFYCHARSDTCPVAQKDHIASSCKIIIHSPQFIDAVWVYRASMVLSAQGKEGWIIEQTAESRKKAGCNPFVSLALAYTLRLAAELKGSDELQSLFQRTSPAGIEITVVADNDFYSQRDTLDLPEGTAPTVEQLQDLAPFTPQKCRIGDVHKTGLGSSAAMTTSLVACFLLHLQAVVLDGPDSIETDDLALIHNLAQLAHCAAQGKVGSGFDVSAAIWGSQLYRRFEPKVLQTCLDEGEKVFTEGEESEEQRKTRLSARIELLPVLDPYNPLWKASSLSGDAETQSTATEGLAVSSNDKVPKPAPLQLPPGLDLLLADVDAGSNTPSLVSKVLAWRKEKPEWAKQLYNVIASSNQGLADNLLRLRILHASDPAAYEALVDSAATQLSTEWDAALKALPQDTEDSHDTEEEIDLRVTPRTLLQALIDVRNSLRSIRAGMRELGQRAGVPIEPPEIGSLIKKISEQIPGVVGGSIPGAGGFDAFYIIYLKSADKPRDLSWLWSQIHAVKEEAESKLTLGPLLSRAGGAKATNDDPSEEPDASEASEHVVELLKKLKASEHASQNFGLRLEKMDNVKGLKEAVARFCERK